MSLSEYFPVFHKLTSQQQELLLGRAQFRSAPQGTLLHNGGEDCLGLLVLRTGQLRSFLTSDEGRQITLYRLFDRDICLFSASCMMRSIQFDVSITVEKDAQFWIIPPDVYQLLMEQSAPVANYTNQLMATRFTDVMWMVEQVLWKRFDQRLAHFLLEESAIEDSPLLKITHEKIAAHLGSAREVVTRMLKYFQSEGMVKLTRGSIELCGQDKLARLTKL